MAVRIDPQTSNVGTSPLAPGGEPSSVKQVIADAKVNQASEPDGLPIEGRTLLQQTTQMVRLAGLDMSQAAEIDAAFARLTPAQQAQLQEVGAQYVGMVNSGDNILNSNAGDALQSRWSDFITSAKLGGGAVDVNALVQWVLRESYQETTKDLYFYAEKVKYFNAVKKAIRDELTEARDFMAKYGVGLEDDQTLGKEYDKDGNATGGTAQSWQGKGISGDFTGTQTDADGNPIDPTMDSSLYKGDPITTKATLDSYIKGLEEKLSSVGDDAQLANVDLQNILQKQQQTIQMMSNISKMLHDTAQAIIRKIGG